jgi:hypothetical protein
MLFLVFINISVFAIEIEIPDCNEYDEDFMFIFNNRFDMNGNDRKFLNWVNERQDSARLPFAITSSYFNSRGTRSIFTIAAKQTAYRCSTKYECGERAKKYLKMIIEVVLDDNINVVASCDTSMQPLPAFSVGN